MTVKEMMIYVDVAIDRIEESKNEINRKNLLEELSYIAYHCNKRDILLEKNIKEEKYF